MSPTAALVAAERIKSGQASAARSIACMCSMCSCRNGPIDLRTSGIFDT
jgi:hypothetical protein